jgi:hypothetical protein
MSSADVLYSARYIGPECIERSRQNVLKSPIYRDGSLAAPASGTITIFDESNTKVVDAAAITVTASIAQYTLASATVASYSFSTDWRVEWSLVMPDGVTHLFQRSAALVRRRLYPVITDTDLIEAHSDLEALRPAGLSSYQSYIDAAWHDILDMLQNAGSFAFLVMEPSAFRRVHLYKTLELVSRDFSTSFGDGSKWDQLAEVYDVKFETNWSRLNFTYDRDNDGLPDARNRPASAVMWLGVGTGRRSLSNTLAGTIWRR